MGHRPPHHGPDSLSYPSGRLRQCAPYWRQDGQDIRPRYPVNRHVAEDGEGEPFEGANPGSGMLGVTPPGKVGLVDLMGGFLEGGLRWSPFLGHRVPPCGHGGAVGRSQTRASASPTVGYPPKPMSRRRPVTTIR